MACLVHVSGLNPIAVSVRAKKQKKQKILTFEKMERRTLCVLCKRKLRCEKKKKIEAPGF